MSIPHPQTPPWRGLPGGYDDIVFTSVNGAERFFARLESHDLDAPRPVWRADRRRRTRYRRCAAEDKASALI